LTPWLPKEALFVKLCRDKPLFVNLFRCKAQLQRYVSVGCYDLRKHKAYSQCNNPLRYIWISSRSTLCNIQLQKKIHDDQVTALQKVKLHLRRRRAISWRIYREGRNVSREKVVVFYKHSRHQGVQP